MKTIEEMIEVMSAHKAGMVVQYRKPGSHWADCQLGPAWNWAEFDYRIKPREPRRIWVNCRAGGITGATWETKRLAELVADGAETVEFVEVVSK